MTITQDNIKLKIRHHMTNLYELYHNVWLSTGETMSPSEFRTYLHQHHPVDYYAHDGALESLIDCDTDLNQDFTGSWICGLVMRNAMGLLDPITVSPSADFFGEDDKARWRKQLAYFEKKVGA